MAGGVSIFFYYESESKDLKHFTSWNIFTDTFLSFEYLSQNFIYS